LCLAKDVVVNAGFEMMGDINLNTLFDFSKFTRCNKEKEKPPGKKWPVNC